MHRKTRPVFIFLLFFLLLASCVRGVPQTATPSRQIPPTEAEKEPKILISEVLAGVEGNNNLEFIELYNTSPTQAVNLQGWTLWYQLEKEKDERILYRWTATAVVPPQGHFLLGRSGEEFEIAPDVYFDTPLAPSRGGLLLRGPDDARGDSLGWGSDPQKYGESERAPAMTRGVSLERKPGGDGGNMVDSGNNRRDFILRDQPQPQNAGSRVTPLKEEYLEVSLAAPDVVEPGSEFQYTFEVSNQTGHALRDVEGEIPLPAELEIVETDPSLSLQDHLVVWRADELAPGETRRMHISVRSPWTYISTKTSNYFVKAENWRAPVYGGPARTTIAGGSIPVDTARTLIGKEVAVEGIATMYTGGYYAGSGNTKFYVADGTAGVQVWVPKGQNKVDVQIGDRVRVQGEIQLYRGAVELVVHDLNNVEVKEESAVDIPLDPLDVSIKKAANDESLAGRLVEVEGKVVRSEEFTYSYELDLASDTAQTLTLYVDKNTDMTTEAVEVGDRYQAQGILEIRDSRLQLYPRLQRDLVKVYPPVLRLTMDAPNTVKPGESFTGKLTAYNHTADPMSDVVISLDLPSNVRLEKVLDGGEVVEGNRLQWEIDDLPGKGAKADVRFELTALGGEYIVLEKANAVAREWKDPAEIAPHYVFGGETIPIWAIQGRGFRSNYILDDVTTAGVVTGVFPELGGFWIQELDSDLDPSTSAGLFINAEGIALDFKRGVRVRVSGTVREQYQQTQIKIDSREDIEILSQTSAAPPPVNLDPPLNNEDSKVYFESLEGMMVQVADPALVVAPTTRYGEFTVVLPEHRMTRLWSAQESGVGITVDDGSYRAHDDRSTLEFVVGVGDKVGGLVGPLAYTFGNYKIEPIRQPRVIDIEQRLPTLPKTAASEFSIATWNVENLFDIQVPHPSDPDMPTVQEYKVDIAKVANTIVSAGLPTVVGLQEVENIGILEDIAAHSSLAEYEYQAVLVEGSDSRGIDVGYLIRGDRAQVLDTEQHVAPQGLTSRPPLAVKVKFPEGEWEGPLYVINNHFTSMSGGVKATEPRRTAQAAWNIKVLDGIREEHPRAHVAVIGDLNSFYQSPPLDTLRDAGLEHVMETLPDKERYNYIYEGRSQLLDHILVTDPLMDRLVRVDVLHTNADFPLPVPGDDSPMRKSDHDLVIATFSLME